MDWKGLSALQYIRIFWSAVLAGVCIAIGGTAFLAADDRAVGALLFGVGLFMVVSCGFHLYTGKVGDLLDNPPAFLLELLVVWLGNLLGAVAVGAGVAATRMTGYVEKAAALAETKLTDTPVSILLLSAFCGFLVYMAVHLYRVSKERMVGVLAVFACVMAFVLCGFEHCVANMFYFTAGGAWSGQAIGYLLLMTLGNSLGGLLIPVGRKLFGWPERAQ